MTHKTKMFQVTSITLQDDMNKIIGQGITFDDVLLLPNFAGFSRSDISLSSKLTKEITLGIPLVSAPMDTVTESKLAIALATLGGIGIIHRNLSITDQAAEVAKVKEQNLLVGAAIGASKGFEERAQALVEAGVDVIVVDSAHGHAKPIVDTISYLKSHFPKLQVIGGSVATEGGAKALIEAGADGLRVGMGPGAICTTRIISGMGVPQITAIFETVRAAKEFGVPVIADGGIKYSGDMVKALAAGASTVMMGSFFASCIEAPGEVIKLKKEQIPSKFHKSVVPYGESDSPDENTVILNSFQNLESKNTGSLPTGQAGRVGARDDNANASDITSHDDKVYLFKSYRGMGSIGAMKRGTEIKSEDEFHGKSYGDRVLVAEGVESLVPVRGTVKTLIEQALGGIRSGMFYVGTKDIPTLQAEGKFLQITQASLTESHPHDVLVTNAGENY